LRYPKVFGKCDFSPSLWVKPDMKIKVDEEDTEDTKIYLYAGGDESDTMIEHVKTSRAIASEFVKDKMKINLSINRKENTMRPIG
jgi:predicted alpha/beta superfamily hydrolase